MLVRVSLLKSFETWIRYWNSNCAIIRAYMKRYFLGVLMGFFLLGTLGSCGKVTQEVKAKDTDGAKAFTISFETEVLGEAGILAAEAEAVKAKRPFYLENYFTLDNDAVYVSVFGFEEDKGWTELSWGQASLATESYQVELKVDPKKNRPQVDGIIAQGVSASAVVSGDAEEAVVDQKVASFDSLVKFVSRARNKAFVTISKPNLGESFLKFREIKGTDNTPNTYDWQVKSDKIKYGYPMYLVSVYAESGNPFFLFSIDADTASKNTLLDQGLLSHYDTFLSSMYVDLIRKKKYQPHLVPSLDLISSVFDRVFFELIDYKRPQNTVKRFNVKAPEFYFDFEIETPFFEVLNLLSNTDKERTIEYVEKIEDERFTKKVKSRLIANIHAVVLEDDSEEVELETEEKKVETTPVNEKPETIETPLGRY